jgi:ribosome-binding protein aMBF1 (putative translation factor)
MSNYKSYKQIKKEFSEERKNRIEDGANEIKKELKLLSEVRQAVGLTEEELGNLLDVNKSDILQVERKNIITVNTLINIIEAMGGSIDVTVNFSDKPSIHFSKIEKIINS